MTGRVDGHNKRTYAVQQAACSTGAMLLDHFVGADEQGGRDFEAERPGCSQVDQPPRLAKVTAERYATELVVYENNGHWLPEE